MDSDDVGGLQPMIIAAALYEEELEFVQCACIHLSGHRDEIVRGNAVLGFGRQALPWNRSPTSFDVSPLLRRKRERPRERAAFTVVAWLA
jgi:hypothetical protein